MLSYNSYKHISPSTKFVVNTPKPTRGGTRCTYSNQSHPRLRSPLLDRLADVVESRTKCFESEEYIYRRVGLFLLLSPFVALVRSPDVEVLTILSSNFTEFFFQDHAGILESFRSICDENIVPGACCHLGVVAVYRGVELRGVVVIILSLQFWNT